MRVHIEHNISRAAAAWRRAPAETAAIMGQFLHRAAIELSRRMRSLAPKATSQLTQSIGIRNLGPLARLVGPTAQYASFVEEGRKAGAMPPVDAIAAWVKVRRLQPNDPGWDEQDLAWAIARKIKQLGIPARPFVEPAVDQMRLRVLALLSEGADRAAARAGVA